MKKFLYLIQGRKNNVLKYTNIKSDNSDVITLTFDEEIKADEFNSIANIFYPKSTWTEGRNKQLKYAKSLPFDYLYYIFIDDDVHFIKGSFHEFEKQLLKYEPAVGIPLLTIIKDTYRYNPKLKIQNPIALDTQYTAFHINTINEGILMPLVTQFDSKSWYYSCEIVNFLILSKYSRSTMQFNEILVDNTGHCWDDEKMQPKDSVSQYVGGITLEGLKEVKEYIVEKYGEQPKLANTLFHDDNYRRYIYIPKGLFFIKVLCKYLITFKLKAFASLIMAKMSNLILYRYPNNLKIDERIIFFHLK